MSEKFSVTFNGFKTKEEANQFATWYSIQGEQQICYWLECRKDEGLIDCDYMNVESTNVDSNDIVVNLRIS